MQPLCGPTPNSAPFVQRPCRATTPGVKEAVQSALPCFADSRLGSVAPVPPRTTSHTEFELLATTSSSSQLADGTTSAQPSTGQARSIHCGVPAPPLQASHNSNCDLGGSIVLRRNIPVQAAAAGSTEDRLERQIDAPAVASEVWGILFATVPS